MGHTDLTVILADQTDGVERSFERNGLSPDRMQKKENRGLTESQIPRLNKESPGTRNLDPLNVTAHAHWARQTLRETKMNGCPIFILFSHIWSISNKVTESGARYSDLRSRVDLMHRSG